MKKLICMILTLVMALSLVACGNKEEKVVSTDGSTSMQKVINALGEAYMADTGATFTYNATGSGMGTAGLVGQITTFQTMVAEGIAPGVVLFEIVLLHFVLPAVLSLAISEFMRKKKWIVDGDMKLSV